MLIFHSYVSLPEGNEWKPINWPFHCTGAPNIPSLSEHMAYIPRLQADMWTPQHPMDGQNPPPVVWWGLTMVNHPHWAFITKILRQNWDTITINYIIYIYNIYFIQEIMDGSWFAGFHWLVSWGSRITPAGACGISSLGASGIRLTAHQTLMRHGRNLNHWSLTSLDFSNWS